MWITCVCMGVRACDRERRREPNINLRLNKSCKAICVESGQQRIICYHWQQVNRMGKEMFKPGAAACFF